MRMKEAGDPVSSGNLKLLLSLSMMFLLSAACWAEGNRVFPGKGKISDWTKARQYQKEADATADRGKLDAAISKIKEARSVYPYEADFPYRQAIYLCRKKEYRNSIPLYKSAIALDPNYAQAYYGLGVAYHELNALVEAEIAYRKARSLNPSNYYYSFNLGALLVDEKRFEEARQEFLHASKLPQAIPEEIEAALRETEEKQRLRRTGRQ